MKQYHCFYVWAYGVDLRYICIDDEEKMLEFVKRTKNPDDGYRNLRIVYGELLEFEPAKVVESWRIKEAS